MNLLRFFKREKAAVEPTGPTAAVLSRPIVEKPASERFGKTVMPNAARVFDTTAGLLSPGSGAGFSLGQPVAPKITPTLAPAAERTIALQLADIVPQISADLVQPVEIDPEQQLVFKAANLERGMANGRPAVLLHTIFQQVPTLFREEIAATDSREIALPFQKVLEQFTNFHVRVDQEPDDAVPEVETPFLKVTMEDSKKFGTPIRAQRPVVSTAPPAPAVERQIEVPIDVPAPASPLPSKEVKTQVATPPATPAPAPKIAPRAPIRLSLPTEPASAPAPVAAAPAPVVQAALPKLFPHGAGVPITERVPASSGSPAPISLPSPLAPAPAPAAAKPAPAAPVRIPFKVTPPASDLCPPPALPLQNAAAPVAFSEGPRVRLSLRNVLRTIPPFQLTGSIESVPEEARIELPFSILQPQLALGRVAISPPQFVAAMPAEFRALYRVDEDGIPVALPLAEILQNLPNESLQLRQDQEEPEVAQIFETPFSQKAAEDAARLKTPAGPISKPTPTPIASAVAVKLPTPPPAPAPLPIVPAAAPETPDAKAIVAELNALPGVKACAVVFSDGLNLAGDLPPEYEADALCAMAPEILKRLNQQMESTNLGALRHVTLFCEKAPVSLFAHDNICLAVLHSSAEISSESVARLREATLELARQFAQAAPAA